MACKRSIPTARQAAGQEGTPAEQDKAGGRVEQHDGLCPGSVLVVLALESLGLILARIVAHCSGRCGRSSFALSWCAPRWLGPEQVGRLSAESETESGRRKV